MQFIYRKIFSFRLTGYSLSWEHFTHMNLLCSCFCPAHYIVKSPWFQEDFTFFSNFLRSNISPAFYGLSGDKTETNANFLSSSFPISTMPFPIVKAATTVPIPRPSILPSPKKVSNAVTIRQVTSKPILILEYGTFVISDTSRGNRSVGTIGSLQRFESAIPKQRIR